jgi:zinc/manganese transport system substrate-binding protein
MRKTITYVIIAILVALLVVGAFSGLYLLNQPIGIQSSGKIQIVAAENFWGSLISQLGGTQVHVFTIVTDPNADPHEFESTNKDAEAVARASFVIVDGAGYDDWALKLISANNIPDQKVLNVANLLGQKVGANPHFWYNPYYVNETVHQMYTELVSLNQTDASYFTQQYANLNASLGVYNQRLSEIKQQFGGTKIAATESIVVYLANATGLDLISPPAFMNAVSEGNDPPAQSIVQFQHQLQSGTVKVLVYNEQTVTPITVEMEAIATQNNVTLVAITETVIPPNALFQNWMNTELISLQNALNSTLSG